MGKRGFSPTTAVLVAVLVGALFMVSKSVTPPPAAPPPPPNEPTALPAKTASAPVTLGKGEKPLDPMARKRQMMADMMKQHGPQSHPKQPAFNPDTIEVTSDYWHQNQPGSQGEAILRDKVAKAKALQAISKVAISPVPPPPGQQKGVPQRPTMSPAPAGGPAPGGTAQ